MTDSEIENLNRTLRKPGGLIPNPATGPNVPANVQAPGVGDSVSLKGYICALLCASRHSSHRLNKEAQAAIHLKLTSIE